MRHGIPKLARLIAASFSREIAKRYADFLPSEQQIRELADVGREVLRAIPPEPGACVLMSAVYAARLQRQGITPAYVVAGSLDVRGQCVFGHGKFFDGRSEFSRSNFDWDGHAWVVFGPYIADISLFRTARSSKSPRVLAEHVSREFTQTAGLLIVKGSDAVLSGLHYTPAYVLTDSQVDALFRGARERYAPGHGQPLTIS